MPSNSASTRVAPPLAMPRRDAPWPHRTSPQEEASGWHLFDPLLRLGSAGPWPSAACGLVPVAGGGSGQPLGDQLVGKLGGADGHGAQQPGGRQQQQQQQGGQLGPQQQGGGQQQGGQDGGGGERYECVPAPHFPGLAFWGDSYYYSDYYHPDGPAHWQGRAGGSYAER